MKGQRFWWMIARFKQHIYRKRKGFLNRILLISCCLFFLFKKSMEKERKDYRKSGAYMVDLGYSENNNSK